MRRALLLAALVACGHEDKPQPLDAYLTAHTADAAATVASWKLDAAGWARVTTDPYRGLYADYARAFDAAAPHLAQQLAGAQRVEVRRHFAGDPRLTLGQARARWAQPVQAPSEIADLDGAPLDAVFVRDGGAWHAIVGVDAIIRAHALPMDAHCAALLDTVVPGACGDAAWVVAEAAVRGDRARFDHACALATNLCIRGTPRP